MVNERAETRNRRRLFGFSHGHREGASPGLGTTVREILLTRWDSIRRRSHYVMTPRRKDRTRSWQKREKRRAGKVLGARLPGLTGGMVGEPAERTWSSPRAREKKTRQRVDGARNVILNMIFRGGDERATRTSPNPAGLFSRKPPAWCSLALRPEKHMFGRCPPEHNR